MLNLNDVDRAYDDHDSLGSDGASSVPHRRMTHFEQWQCEELTDQAMDANAVAWIPIEDAIDNLMGFAVDAGKLGTDNEKGAELAAEAKAAIAALSDSNACLMLHRMNEIRDAVTIGIQAGQRTGLRLGLGLMSRLLLGEDNGTPIPALPTPQLMALLAGAGSDDSMADRLIGWLLTGHEPEFVKGPAPKEGGAHK